MKLSDLTSQAGEWLRGSGPMSEIVISSRIRLARNISGYPFLSRCSRPQRQTLEGKIRETILGAQLSPQTLYVDLESAPEIDRQLLVERHLISKPHKEAEGARGVAIGENETLAIMVNEEDHLRIQVLRSGLQLEEAWEQINAVDDQLESTLDFAFHPRFGYLTACPTNVGTGVRVSVMLHLPALVITRQIDKLFRSLQKISLAVRGLYGEGSQAMGDFYQISNQITLGRSETDLVKQVGDVVPTIIDYERKAREFLVRESQENLHDRVSRAYGILRTAQTISSEETMHLLSSVRMGVNLGLIHDLEIPTLNKLFIYTQPAHLQKLSGVELDTADRNIERARYLRRYLNKENGNSGSLHN
jgi:protein arginine kinase